MSNYLWAAISIACVLFVLKWIYNVGRLLKERVRMSNDPSYRLNKVMAGDISLERAHRMMFEAGPSSSTAF